MSAKIQIKRGTTAQWASSNNDTTLAPGQLGVEYLTSGYSRLKVGTDDSTHSSTDWADLDYLTPSTETYDDNAIRFSPSTGGTAFALQWNSDEVGLSNASVNTRLRGNSVILTTYPVNGVAGNFTISINQANKCNFTSDGIIPATNNSYTLGNTSYRFSYAYLNGININSAGTGYITPVTNGSGYIGNSSYHWGTGYINSLYATTLYSSSGNLQVGDTLVPTATTYALGASTSGDQWGRVYVADASGSTFTSTSNGICFGTDAYPTIQHYSTSLYFNPSGSTTTGGRLTLNTRAFYPSTNGGCDLGTSSNGWDNLYMSDQSFIRSGTKYIAYDADSNLYIGANGINSADFTYTQLMGKDGIILRAFDADVSVNLDVSLPGSESFHPSNNSDISLNLGNGSADSRWGVVFCRSVSESSDVSLKSDIHYLGSPQVNLLSTADVQEEQYITVEDVLEFISELKPATFVYRSKDISTVADAEELDMEAIHLGIIANDIEDSKLFEYVASKHETTTTLEDGTTKIDKNLSIKPASLAVAALTACKYLINQVKELKEMLNNGNN